MWVGVVVSCAHQQLRPLPFSVRAQFADWFVSCHPVDGSSSFQLRHEAGATHRLEGDWVVDAQGDLALELYGPLGNTLVAMQLRQRQLLLEGVRAQNQPSIDEQGEVTFQGWSSALRSEELGCLLQGRLPSMWLERATLAQSNQLKMQDKQREVVVTIDQERACFVTSRYYFGFMRYAGIAGCVDRQRNVSIDLGSGYQIQIENAQQESDLLYENDREG